MSPSQAKTVISPTTLSRRPVPSSRGEFGDVRESFACCFVLYERRVGLLLLFMRVSYSREHRDDMLGPAPARRGRHILIIQRGTGSLGLLSKRFNRTSVSERRGYKRRDMGGTDKYHDRLQDVRGVWNSFQHC